METDTHLNKSALKDRGWTDSMIDTYLGEPDYSEYMHLHGRVSTYVRWFSRDKVEAAEQDPTWIARRERNDRDSVKRSIAAMKGARTRELNELLANDAARHELVPYIDQPIFLTGTYEIARGKTLLTDVRLDDKLMTDHVWVYEMSMDGHEVNYGDRVEVLAVPEIYRKGYMGYRPEIPRGTSLDVGLARVAVVRVIARAGAQDPGDEGQAPVRESKAAE